MLDKTIHEVGADPKLYEVEHNLTSNDVTEQVIKGNVAIIKHTDDGETKIETPEKGASFEIYLKSAGSYDGNPVISVVRIVISGISLRSFLITATRSSLDVLLPILCKIRFSLC